MSWTFPTSETLGVAHGAMAKVATTSPVSTFLIGLPGPTMVSVLGNELLDVAYWVLETQVLVGLVNLDYVAQNRTIVIDLPLAISSLVSQPWGSVNWAVGNGTLTAHGLAGLMTSLVVLDM
ncbi:hypothetical protein LTR22_019413 [Elasticomyces elasticus]|nr:hypothetical protein LTR22_019413 [Elasticomyces elasticus]